MLILYSENRDAKTMISAVLIILISQQSFVSNIKWKALPNIFSKSFNNFVLNKYELWVLLHNLNIEPYWQPWYVTCNDMSWLTSITSPVISRNFKTRAVYMNFTSAAPPPHVFLREREKMCTSGWHSSYDTAAMLPVSLDSITWAQWGRAKVERRCVTERNNHISPAFTLGVLAWLNCASDFPLHHRHTVTVHSL